VLFVNAEPDSQERGIGRAMTAGTLRLAVDLSQPAGRRRQSVQPKGCGLRLRLAEPISLEFPLVTVSARPIAR
jgi:hypothetical protein